MVKTSDYLYLNKEIDFIKSLKMLYIYTYESTVKMYLYTLNNTRATKDSYTSLISIS